MPMPDSSGKVVLNLCINARDAMPAGSELRVTTAAVRVAVADTGTGIDEESRARLFEPIITTKEEGRGTGLCPAMVCGIVKQHGRYLDVDSAPSRGATFSIFLPAHGASAVSSTAVDPTTPAMTIPGACGGTETVLVAEEDEQNIRDLAVMVLDDAGDRVPAAPYGLAALELYRSHRGDIALAVLDAAMPRLSGIDALRRMREEGTEVPVLYASGYTVGAVREHLARETGAELLQKPILMHELLARVRGLLDRAQRGGIIAGDPRERRQGPGVRDRGAPREDPR